MNRIIVFWGLFFLVSLSSSASIHTVVNSGFTFSPNTITINMGDTVIFSLDIIHAAKEVSQVTWNANGNTSNGGFSTLKGGGTVIMNQLGTFYYVCANHYFMGMKGTITVVSPTGVNTGSSVVPREFALAQNFPNPFNPGTTIKFELPVESRVKVKVMNVEGKIIATLVDQIQAPGYQSIYWDGSNSATGIYFYKLEAISKADPNRIFKQVKKMLLLK
jgi:plastocyanin